MQQKILGKNYLESTYKVQYVKRSETEADYSVYIAPHLC